MEALLEVTRVKSLAAVADVRFAEGEFLNLYGFGAVNKVDPFGLQECAPVWDGPRPGDPCCEEPCQLSLNIEHLSAEPTYNSAGEHQGWDFKFKMTPEVESGTCIILWYSFWNCNTGVTPDDPFGWTCADENAGYTYPGPPPRRTAHAKAIQGRVHYLSCEGGAWTVRSDDSGFLTYGLQWAPAEAYEHGRQVYPGASD